LSNNRLSSIDPDQFEGNIFTFLKLKFEI